MGIRGRAEIEKWEREQLAPYAARAAESRGRVYPAHEHPLRTAFQRDRDRIIHSSAFRRMEYKTQVFLPHEGDHYRTRLTHTIEVSQISRTLARCLCLNEDLAEAIALVHDLGHTPFGHAGEDVLDELMQDCGGFNHNRQSLKIVDTLEQRYAEHPGLNLSFEVREGIAKHETKRQLKSAEFDPVLRPTLEASLVDIADELAYNAHDIDDAVSAGILQLEDLRRLRIFAHPDSPFLHQLPLGQVIDDQKRHILVRYLVNLMVTDVLSETERQLTRLKVYTLDDLRRASEKICRYSPDMKAEVTELKTFLMDHLYRHPRLMDMTLWAKEIIETLFKKYCDHPELLPKRFQEMMLTEERKVVIADYIAGMTDRYAEKAYEEFN